MEAVIQEHEKLLKSGGLEKGMEDVQRIIDMLEKARDAVVADPDTAGLTLAKLQNPVREGFETVNGDLKEVYKRLNNYDKALSKKFKDKPSPSTEDTILPSNPALINRAIVMHLLREGHFDVAAQLVDEAVAQSLDCDDDNTTDQGMKDIATAMQKALETDVQQTDELRRQFSSMHHILHQLRKERDLQPAIAWAREHSTQLERRGSNLEFELGRLQFVWLFTGGGNTTVPRPQDALLYARTHFSHFQARYMKQIVELSGSMAYAANLPQSPYAQIFHQDYIWDELADHFTKEFCSLHGLSADSPLYLATTAGAIALPTLLKYQTIAKAQKTEWTTQQELPVEIPLPPSYRFHSIFVCPVSKEQTTDSNPPMMMSCGHVIALETMSRMSRGAPFKCPYCPGESRPSEARKLYL